jgi:hypothetical protein
MRTEYLAAIAIAAFAAGAGLAAYSVRGQADFCPQPSAASVTALFAPCQTFDTAMGRAVTKKEAVRMGLLMPDEQPALTPEQQPAWPATLLAARLAESVDPFLHRSGG